MKEATAPLSSRIAYDAGRDQRLKAELECPFRLVERIGRALNCTG